MRLRTDARSIAPAACTAEFADAVERGPWHHDWEFPDPTPRPPPTAPLRRGIHAGSPSRGARRMNTFSPINGTMPIDLAHIDELARRLSSLVPGSLRESREELQQNFKSVLQTGLGKLDLVTRDEFDVQRAVLLRTRDKLNELQRAIDRIEAQLAPDPQQN